MLRSLLLLAAFGLALAPATLAQERASDAPRVSPNAHVGQTFGFTNVDVTYGRPAINDRSLFADGSELAPYAEIWRAGANEATTVTFSTDAMVEGQAIEAGTYALFVVPANGAWSVHFNREANQWGAFGHDPALDAVVASVMPQMTTESGRADAVHVRRREQRGRDAAARLGHDAPADPPQRRLRGRTRRDG